MAKCRAQAQFRRVSLCHAVLLLAWCSLDLPTAHAEDQATPQSELLTITITARRIEESAQDVPISVVNVSDKTITQAGITTAQELQQVVSGLQVSVPNPRLTQFTLRGLGSSAFVIPPFTKTAIRRG